jgi:hypothetical protein
MLMVVAMLAVAAGVVMGVVIARLPSRNAAAAPPTQPADATGLAAELNLTPGQSEEMKKIWEGVREQLRDGFSKADGLQRRRDAEIVNLLTQEQRAEFEKLTRRYAKEYDQIQAIRRSAFDRGVAETRRLLNDEQRRRYDAVLKSRVRTGGGDGWPFPDDAAATTSSTTQQSRGTP